jgi:hypothetical protein
MVDQTTVTPQATNGPETPPQAVARSSIEFLHDLITLGELQAKLVMVDVKQGVKRLAVWAGVLVIGGFLALACFPLCITAVALGIAEAWHLSMAQAFGLSVFLGLLIAAGMIGAAVVGIRNHTNFLERSWTEWRQNVRWVKETLRRLSSPSRNGRFPPAAPR